MDMAYVTAAVAVLSLVVAFATWLGKTKSESGQQNAHNASVMTELRFIGNDIKEIKAQQGTINKEIEDVRVIAVRAEESAKAAHRRLDRLGIDDHHEQQN